MHRSASEPSGSRAARAGAGAPRPADRRIEILAAELLDAPCEALRFDTHVDDDLAGREARLYYYFDTWYGLYAQKDIFERLNPETRKALEAPDFKKRAAALGLELTRTMPEQLAKHQRAEIAR